jgi:transcriptional regulator with XRE-family HTH domain
MTETAQPAPHPQDRYWIVILDGARLHRLRIEHGLTKAGLAHRAGLSPATVANLERDPERRCYARTAVRLATALALPPTALLRDQPPAS